MNSFVILHLPSLMRDSQLGTDQSIGIFQTQLLQYNTSYLRYTSMLTYSPVSTACSSCMTRKKKKGLAGRKGVQKSGT